MAKIVFIEANGEKSTIEGITGDTLMETAVDNGIQGILGSCGGGMACSTCHCFVDEAWMEIVGKPDEAEGDMLEFTAVARRDNSRLACQISITKKLDGLVVWLPEEQ